MKTDSVFLGVHVLRRDLVMGELGAAWLCWCCYRGIILKWYRKDFFYTDTHLTYCRQVLLVHELVLLQSARVDWQGASCRAFPAVPFQMMQPYPKGNDQACPLSASHLHKSCANLCATLKKWWVSMCLFFSAKFFYLKDDWKTAWKKGLFSLMTLFVFINRT